MIHATCFDWLFSMGPMDQSINNPIRNAFKWFKHLQNIFETYLNPILRFSKCFQVNVYTVMFKKHFINILYPKVLTENVYYMFIK